MVGICMYVNHKINRISNGLDVKLKENKVVCGLSKKEKQGWNLFELSYSLLCVCVLSYVWLSVAPWAIVLQALLSMEFSRQEYSNNKKKKEYSNELPFTTLFRCMCKFQSFVNWGAIV